MEGQTASCLVCQNSQKQLLCPLCACNTIDTKAAILSELSLATSKRTELARNLQEAEERKVSRLIRSC